MKKLLLFSLVSFFILSGIVTVKAQESIAPCNATFYAETPNPAQQKHREFWAAVDNSYWHHRFDFGDGFNSGTIPTSNATMTTAHNYLCPSTNPCVYIATHTMIRSTTGQELCSLTLEVVVYPQAPPEVQYEHPID